MQLVQEKKCNVPAVLNMLQLMLTKSNSGDYIVGKQAIEEEPFPVTAHARVVKVMAELDAAYGCATNTAISRRAKLKTVYQATTSDSTPAQDDFNTSVKMDEYGIFGQTSAILDEFLEHACFAELPSLR